jgi:hypothetical protein
MTHWGVTAASGLPLDETIAALRDAGQTYSTAVGIIFAMIGAVLGLAWAALSLATGLRRHPWFSVAVWAAIIAFGAPAYFFASFGNLNSVGDTFWDWNADAAFASVVPLYIASAFAALLCIAAIIIGAVRAARANNTAATTRSIGNETLVSGLQ